jgi:hypothetical protein
MTKRATTVPVSPARRARILATFAIASALLSTFAGVDTNARLAGWPFLPGIYFGAALASGVYLWVTKSPLRLLAIVIGVIVAWYLGFQTAIGVNLSLRELMKPYQDQNALWITAFTGVCGGFVGAFMTAATIALICKDFRAVANWVRTSAVGAAAGVMLIFFSEASRWPAPTIHEYLYLVPLFTPAPEHFYFLPLFIVWQPAVAATIGYGLVQRKR